MDYRSVVEDPDRLDRLVDGMAGMLASVLSIEDEIGNSGKCRLGKVLYEEKEHFPTRATLDLLEKILNAYNFCVDASTLCAAICADAKQEANVVLGQYTKHDSFYFGQTFTRTRGQTQTHLRVGGIGESLLNAVEEKVAEWLVRVDYAMCAAFVDHGDSQERASTCSPMGSEMMMLIDKLSTDIAQRLTLMEPERQPYNQLSARSLGARAGAELCRTSYQAEAEQQHDLAALRALEAVATNGSTGERVKAIIENTMHLIEYVVRRPPIELGMHGANATRMNLPLLAEACAPNLDTEVRCTLIQHWHECHGACAATAAQQAIIQIERWSQQQQPPFIEVLIDPATDPPSSAIAMPVLPFVEQRQNFFFANSGTRSTKRTGLDWMGRRVVRLTSLVWQLLGYEELERGVLSSRLVDPIVTAAVFQTHVVAEMLVQKRNSYALGQRLLGFAENISDAQSHLSDEVGHACCELSRFSAHEILAVFHMRSPVLPLVMRDLSIRTRTLLNEMGHSMPPEYTAFASDALAIALPVIRDRRQCAGISLATRTNPISDLLRTVPKVREWSPLEGALWLHTDDLKRAAPMLKPVLKVLCKRQALVEWKRPYIRGSIGYAKHTKLAYVFETAQLVKLLQM
tara:strand:- start:19132 stop:21018 length:1887 start_codon:yes stop_codon:yes gene_type:complete